MTPLSLPSLADEKLAQARQASSGRAAHTVHGGHWSALRQTMLALAAGRELAEHDSPGEATLHVLHGRVRLLAGRESWDCETGDYLAIPPTRHALSAVTDAVVLLTVVTQPKADREVP